MTMCLEISIGTGWLTSGYNTKIMPVHFQETLSVQQFIRGSGTLWNTPICNLLLVGTTLRRPSTGKCKAPFPVHPQCCRMTYPMTVSCMPCRYHSSVLVQSNPDILPAFSFAIFPDPQNGNEQIDDLFRAKYSIAPNLHTFGSHESPH